MKTKWFQVHLLELFIDYTLIYWMCLIVSVFSLWEYVEKKKKESPVFPGSLLSDRGLKG